MATEQKPTFKELRLSFGLTQSEAAHKVNASVQVVCNWENGRATPGPDKYPLIAKLFGITPLEAVRLFNAPAAA